MKDSLTIPFIHVIMTIAIVGLIHVEWPVGLPIEERPRRLPSTPNGTALCINLALLEDMGTRVAKMLPGPTFVPRNAEAATAAASATPASIPIGQPTEVIVTIQLADTRLIAESVNLQQIDSNGTVLAVLGSLNDQGTDGDLVAGDRVFTARQVFSEATATTILLRVSWAARGGVGRVTSATLRIEAR